MEIEAIRKVRLGRPFRPFNLVLQDGRKLPVEGPFQLAISPSGNEVAYGSEKDGPQFIAASTIRDIEFVVPHESGRT